MILIRPSVRVKAGNGYDPRTATLNCREPVTGISLPGIETKRAQRNTCSHGAVEQRWKSVSNNNNDDCRQCRRHCVLASNPS